MAVTRAEVLGPRALNRATLARQLLLRRAEMPPLAALEHLVGLQAQVPLDPYTALWSRLVGFRPEELGALVDERRAVRVVVMRATIHLVSAEDCLVLRPLMQPVLDRELAGHHEFRDVLRGVEMGPVLAFARELLAERPHSGTQLRAALAARFPARDASALAYACRNLLALVQVPPRGVWGHAGQVCSTTAEAWLGRPLAVAPALEDVVLRYLGAFGPASAADVAAWSRLPGLREVMDRLRPRLRVFRDAGGRAARRARRPVPRPGHRRRCASCASTTTPCSRTPTAPGSSPPSAAPSWRGSGRRSTAQCCTTASCAPSGASRASAPRRSPRSP